MNYCTLTIGEETIGLKFGMASFRYLSEKLAEGKTHTASEINELGIAHIMYSGYHNNCLTKDVSPSYTFEFFADYVEGNLTNQEALKQIKEILEVWTSNQYIQNVTKDEPKKKTSPSKKSKPTPTGK